MLRSQLCCSMFRVEDKLPTIVRVNESSTDKILCWRVIEFALLEEL